MQVNLERKAPPTITQPRQMPTPVHNAAAVALAFTITMSSSVSREDYTKRMMIGPASLNASADRTNAVWFKDKGGEGESWLAKAITQMHAAIPDKAWDEVPDTSHYDIDDLL